MPEAVSTKHSSLRIAAQYYSCGAISRHEYRNFRSQVLQALVAGQTEPALPSHWRQDSTQPLENEKIPVAAQPDPRWRRLGLVLAAVIALVAISTGIYDWTQAAPQRSLLKPTLPAAAGQFQHQVAQIIFKDVWLERDIKALWRGWQTLTPQDQQRIMDHPLFATLSDALQQRHLELQAIEMYSNDPDSLRRRAAMIEQFMQSLQQPPKP